MCTGVDRIYRTSGRKRQVTCPINSDTEPLTARPIRSRICRGDVGEGLVWEYQPFWRERCREGTDGSIPEAGGPVTRLGSALTRRRTRRRMCVPLGRPRVHSPRAARGDVKGRAVDRGLDVTGSHRSLEGPCSARRQRMEAAARGGCASQYNISVKTVGRAPLRWTVFGPPHV